MGTLVEFYSLPDSEPETPAPEANSRTLVGSLSVNSHRVGDLLTAFSNTGLKPLVGDGSDPLRTQVVPMGEMNLLQQQIAGWQGQGSDFLDEVFEAVNDAIEEARWAGRELLIVIN